ncbi:MAG: hypothetical protein ACYTXI_27635 [Nostoc sp.]
MKLNYLEQQRLLELLQEVVRKNHPVARVFLRASEPGKVMKILSCSIPID